VLPGDDAPLSDADEIAERLKHHVDLFLDAGFGGVGFTTIIDLSDTTPTVVRRGLGGVAEIGLE
jgi:tRNA A37 threonylcarbamoyladenosine synthetase subunit TsaC/SUA5/YrdC